MNGLKTMFKKELLETVRSKRLLILVILFAFISISSPILAKLIPTILGNMPSTPGLTINIPEPTWKDAIDQLVKNIGQIGMIVIIIMFAGAVAEEKNKKTLELVLTKPISRVNFILAKYGASIFWTKIVFILSMIVFYLYTISLFGGFGLVNFIWLSLFLLVYIILVLSMTLFFSTISKSQIMAVGLAFLTEIVFAAFIGIFKKAVIYAPDYVIANYKNLMANGNIRDFLPSMFVSIAVIVIFVLLSLLFFRRQEVER